MKSHLDCNTSFEWLRSQAETRPQRKQPPIPSLNDLNKQLTERMGIFKKADENIINTIEMLLREGINPIPVFVNAISKYCPQLPPPLPSRYSQAPSSFPSPAQAPSSFPSPVQAPSSFSNPAQTAPLTPYHAQKTDHILTEFDVKVGEKSNSRCGSGKYEHTDPVRLSFVERQKRGSAVMVDGGGRIIRRRIFRRIQKIVPSIKDLAMIRAVGTLSANGKILKQLNVSRTFSL